MQNNKLQIEYLPTDQLQMYDGNANIHSAHQIDQIAESIEEFDFSSPILAWHNEDGEAVIVAGHGRLMAARKLGIEELPVVFLDHMTEEQRRAYILVDNQLTMNSGFDADVLSSELERIMDIDMSNFDFDVSPDGTEVDASDAPVIEEIALSPFEKVHYLITADMNKNDEIIDMIQKIREVGGVEVKSTLN